MADGWPPRHVLIMPFGGRPRNESRDNGDSDVSLALRRTREGRRRRHRRRCRHRRAGNNRRERATRFRSDEYGDQGRLPAATAAAAALSPTQSAHSCPGAARALARNNGIRVLPFKSAKYLSVVVFRAAAAALSAAVVTQGAKSKRTL